MCINVAVSKVGMHVCVYYHLLIYALKCLKKSFIVLQQNKRKPKRKNTEQTVYKNNIITLDNFIRLDF
jgi:hypothetical protein